jgi:hypothetical protein
MRVLAEAPPVPECSPDFGRAGRVDGTTTTRRNGRAIASQTRQARKDLGGRSRPLLTNETTGCGARRTKTLGASVAWNTTGVVGSAADVQHDAQALHDAFENFEPFALSACDVCASPSLAVSA